MQIGIIGTGRHGSRYDNHLRHELAGRLELVAISRRSEAGAGQAADWGVTWHREWRQLVENPAVQAVIAATTPNLHLEIAEGCVAAGKPLLIEKPLGRTAHDAARIVELFAGRGLPLTVAQTLRYNPTIIMLRREFQRLGELFGFAANLRLEGGPHPWLDNPALAGGVVFNAGVHLFDSLHFITGRPVRRVCARVGKRNAGNLPDHCAALLELDNGVVGTAVVGKLGAARSGRYEFNGSKGLLQGDQVHGFCEFVQGASISELGRHGAVSALVPLLEEWHAHLQGEGANPIPGPAGLQAVRIAEACLRSAREEQWVAVE